MPGTLKPNCQLSTRPGQAQGKLTLGFGSVRSDKTAHLAFLGLVRFHNSPDTGGFGSFSQIDGRGLIGFVLAIAPGLLTRVPALRGAATAANDAPALRGRLAARCPAQQSRAPLLAVGPKAGQRHAWSLTRNEALVAILPLLI
jgi:hypothetical protein